MVNTPYKDLGSQDILSAHISGIQHDINKVQELLDMQTDSVEGHELVAVNDQDDPALRYRIYEGTIRNWLDDPKPVIYRNGSTVDENEYSLQSPYGVIVFHEQQSSGDEIVADFSYINSNSKTINDIENNINSIIDDVDELKTHADEVDEDIITIDEELERINDEIEKLKQNGSGGGGGEIPDNYNILGGVSPFYMASGSYMSHYKRNYDPVTEDGYNTQSHKPSFNVLVYGDTIDAFPFPVTAETTFKQAGIMLGDGSSDSVDVRIGLYKDNGKLYPSELVFQSPIITVNPNSWGYVDINVTIPAGLYWIARHDGNTAYWNGLASRSVINIQKFDGESFLRNLAERPNPFSVYGGYRATNIPFGNMPDPFPSGIELFRRNDYCSPWLITE